MNHTSVVFVADNLTPIVEQVRQVSDLEVIASYCAQYVQFEVVLHVLAALLLAGILTMNILEAFGVPVKERYPLVYRFFDFQVFAVLLIITLINLVVWGRRFLG